MSPMSAKPDTPRRPPRGGHYRARPVRPRGQPRAVQGRRPGRLRAVPARPRKGRAGARHRLPAGAEAAGAQRRRAARSAAGRGGAAVAQLLRHRPAHLQLDPATTAWASCARCSPAAPRPGPTSSRSAPSCSCRPTRSRCAARSSTASRPPPSCPRRRYEPAHPQLRIAFDGDAVIFGDESERVSQESGLAAFHSNEATRVNEPLSGGPFRGFLAALHELQAGLPAGRGLAAAHRAGHRALGARARARDPHPARVGRAPGRSHVPRRPRQGPVPGSLRRRHLLRRFARTTSKTPAATWPPGTCRTASPTSPRRSIAQSSGRSIPVSFQVRPLRLNSNTTGWPSAFCTVAVNSEGDT